MAIPTSNAEKGKILRAEVARKILQKMLLTITSHLFTTLQDLQNSPIPITSFDMFKSSLG